MPEAISAATMPIIAGSSQQRPPTGASAPSTAASAPEQHIQHISPAFRFDPQSGLVITEYFDNEGKVQTQIPSAASIAYRQTEKAGSEPKESVIESAAAAMQAVVEA